MHKTKFWKRNLQTCTIAKPDANPLLSAAALFQVIWSSFLSTYWFAIVRLQKKQKKEGRKFFSLGRKKTKALLDFLAFEMALKKCKCALFVGGIIRLIL